MKAMLATAATRAFERGIEIVKRALVGLALVALSASAAGAATARVQYLSNANVYLDAGRSAGLQEGSIVRVERSGEVVAELVVQFVAEHSAACAIRSSKTTLRPGDVCVFEAVARTATVAGSAAAGGISTGRSGFDWIGRMRGSLAMGFTQSQELSGTFQSPTLRADAWWSGRGEERFGLRLRGSRPEVALPTATTARVRLEEAAARYRTAGGRWDVEAGRFFASGLEAMGPMDGGALRVRGSGAFEVAVAGGAVPDDIVSGSSTSGWKLGALLEVHDPRRTGPRRWRVAAGAVRIDDVDVTRRQFVLQRADAQLGTRVRLTQDLEVEVNPGWKRALGEPQVEIGRAALSTHVGLHPRLALMAGADTHRDQLLPEHRGFTVPIARERTHGVQASTRFGVTRALALRGGAGMRLHEDGSRQSTTWDASFDAANLGTPALCAMAHVHGYEASKTRGTVVSGTLRWSAARRLRVEAGAGRSIIRALDETNTTTSWLYGGFDLDVGSRTWIAANGEIHADTGGNQFNVQLGQRF